MTYTYVTDCAQIDLNRHAFIEASAGTGKTYTIENLVVRMLVEKPDVELENILLVTFTEKATSELKQRIQEKLEEVLPSLEHDPALAKKIKGALDAFDTASIYTIHGFCQTVLRDFAFENGALFTHEVIDDGPLFDTLFKEQMRKRWPTFYGESLSTLLSLSGFTLKKDQFFSLVTRLARSIHPDSNDEIIPHTQAMDSKQRILGITDGVKRLKTLVGPSFFEAFELLNLKKKPKDLLRSFLHEISRDNVDITRLSPVLNSMGMFNNTSDDDLWLKNKKNSEVCPDISKLIEALSGLFEQNLVLPHVLVVESMERLRMDAALAKQQNGWLSYDDMISRVTTALYGENAPELLHRLRQKYMVAFVDEFQDTDAGQWKIFSKIFLENLSETQKNFLYLIGDPKQAIYSFRGADVFVYLDAKNRMISLAGQVRANLYTLATNWRSQPELINAFNRLFSRKAWFLPQDQTTVFDIGYQDVGYPDEPLRPEILVTDLSGRPAFNVVDISRHTLAKRVKSDLADFITHEINVLMAPGTLEIKKKDQPKRPLDYGDICILVRGKNDFALLEPMLITKKIPYTYYKKPGLFFSDEALYLSLLFHAILDPGNSVSVRKALLTPFFDFHADELHAYDNQSPTHPVKQLLASLNALAQTRKWSCLFQSIMEDTGLIFRQASSHDWDRKQTNYSQIFEHLECLAYKRNLDFRGLSARLDSYRNHRADVDDDADIHQIETEDRKVQVMTMHVSKGLQFPIVFVAGGLATSNRAPYYMYHRYQDDDPSMGVHKVIDLSRETGKDQHEKEGRDEDKRIFYVALTRAQFKLYVPYYAPDKSHRLNGPIPGIVTPSIDAAFQRHEDLPGVLWLSQDNPCESTTAPLRKQQEGHLPLSLPCPGDFRARRYRMESFSSLHGMLSYGEDRVFHPGGSKEREADEPRVDPPVVPISPALINELPGGTNTGSMLHDILETIDFQSVAGNPHGLLLMDKTRETIEKKMTLYTMDPCYTEAVSNIISSTLTACVPVSEGTIILGHLKPSDRLHETEFYFPMPTSKGNKPHIPDLDIKTGPKGYIRGFIDLIFQVHGRFYIADWKSNYLSDGYSREAMEQSMAHAGYHLQYKIYTVATLRWLKKILGNRFDPATHFGGIFYFYLRGMGQGDGHGIYHVTPEEVGRIDHLEQDIAHAAGHER